MYGVVCIIAFLVFITDFFIKNHLLANTVSSTPLIKNILYITVVLNKGAAFGMLAGQTTFLIYVGIIFVLFFLISIKRGKRRDFLFLVSSGLILGGALSNLYDRILLGYVVDYIDIRIWPVFNLSDSCISIGVFLLLIDSFKKNGKKNNCS
ncbi:MAG: signal peptidase II [Candidatus Omnitrophota bacterium]|nr:signal peptidase II [Candidatus Omnitrophota bacterium]